MVDKQPTQEQIKPVSECKSLAEVMATLNHLCKELNGIKGVKASFSIKEQ